MTEFVTSAGRLLLEARRIKEMVSNQNAFSTWIPVVFGDDDAHWTRGISAYVRLCETFGRDAAAVGGARVGRYIEAKESALRIADPQQFQTPAQGLVTSALDNLTMERVEAADELLTQTGRAASVDLDKLQMVIGELKEVLEDLSADGGDIESYLHEKIRELIYVFERFNLYGPSGVEDAISILVGNLQIKSFYGVPLSSETEKQIKRVIGIAKAALDAVVYTKVGVEALMWAGTALALLAPGSSN
jgi:hypothetical protein